MPYTGIVLAFLAAFLAIFLILIAHWIVTAGLFPQAAQKLADEYGRRPIRAILLGIFTYGPLQVIGLRAGDIHNPVVKFLAIAASLGSLLLAFIGTAGLALRIGRNLSPGGDPWQQSLRGGVMLALCFITPVLGWFFVSPVCLASGFGALFLARPWKKQQASPLPISEAAPAMPAAPNSAAPEPALS
jgi:hypothetical protein